MVQSCSLSSRGQSIIYQLTSVCFYFNNTNEQNQAEFPFWGWSVSCKLVFKDALSLKAATILQNIITQIQINQ